MNNSLRSKDYVEKAIEKLEKDEAGNLSIATLSEVVFFCQRY